MMFALTTRWNAGRHTDGRAMMEEIAALGFKRVELGYDLRLDLVPGVTKAVAERVIRVDSVHNFCPVPVGAPRPSPELFTLADPDRRTRDLAVEHTGRTLRFAAEIGARVAVVHAGNVRMPPLTGRLFALFEQGRQFTEPYEKAKLKLQVKRDKAVRRQLGFLAESLERLAPVMEECRVMIALENLPTWESMPTEAEMMGLLMQFGGRGLRYWHDLGHGQIRENLGLINQERWLEKLQPHLAGMHLHDVAPPGFDHLMPPRGRLDFPRYARFGRMDILRVIEPSPRVPAEEIVEALAYLKQAWGPETAGGLKRKP